MNLSKKLRLFITTVIALSLCVGTTASAIHASNSFFQDVDKNLWSSNTGTIAFLSYKNRDASSLELVATSNKAGILYYTVVPPNLYSKKITTKVIKSGSISGVGAKSGEFPVIENQPTSHKIEGVSTEGFSIYAVLVSETGIDSELLYVENIPDYFNDGKILLPYPTIGVSQLCWQFTGELKEGTTRKTNPSAFFTGGKFRNYGYGYVTIKSIEWDLTRRDMPILIANFDKTNLGDGESYGIDVEFVKKAFRFKDAKISPIDSEDSTHEGLGFNLLVTKQLTYEAGEKADPTKAEAVFKILNSYFNNKLNLIDYNILSYQQALAEASGKYETPEDVKAIIDAVNKKHPEPSQDEQELLNAISSTKSGSFMGFYLESYANVIGINRAIFTKLNENTRDKIGKYVLDQRDKHPLKEYINVQEIRDAAIKGYENVTGKRYPKKKS